MKTIFKILFLSGIIVLTNFGCEKHEVPAPGLAVYKTKGDYFNLVTIGMKGNDIFRVPTFKWQKYKLVFTANDTIYKYRLPLIDGYVLDAEADEKHDVFLSLTFKRYLIMEGKFNECCLPYDTLKKYIIDKDPYTEFYRETKYPYRFSTQDLVNDTAEINTIIRNGELEKYFEKIK